MPTVKVAKPSYGTLAKTLPATGTLVVLTDRQATLSPAVSGVLSSLPIYFGERVVAGQLVAQLDTGPLQGQLLQAQAALGQSEVQVQQAKANATEQVARTRADILQAQSKLSAAQATQSGASATLVGDEAALHNAQQNLSREKTLFADGLVAQKDVETATLSVRTAEAQVNAQRQVVEAQKQTVNGQRQALAAAQAASLQNSVKRQDVQVARQQVQNASGALATAQSQEALYTLRAPLSGNITQIGASIGETVTSSTKIATIENLNLMQLRIALPGNSSHKVAPGQQVIFTVPNLPGKAFHTVITAVSPQVDPATGTLTALALVSNPGDKFPADSTAKVQIVIKQAPNVLTVPDAAILTDPSTNQTSVVVISSDQTAHIVPVTTGLSAGGKTEILKGLTVAQTVAVSDQYSIPDGAAVHVSQGESQHGN